MDNPYYALFKGATRSANDGAAGSGLQILQEPGAGKRNRIYQIILTSRSAIAAVPMDFLLSDGIGTVFGDTGNPITLNFGPSGWLQTSNTALTVTSDTTCEVGAVVIYSVESDLS